MTDIGDGIEIPGEIVVTDDDVNGFAVTLSAVYEADSGRYACRKVAVHGTPAGAEVTGKALREIPVAKVLRAGLLAELLDVLPPQASGGLPPERLQGRAQERMFHWVARRYRLALLVGDPPTQAIANELHVTRSTAGRWVTRVRDRGLLTVRDPRGAR